MWALVNSRDTAFVGIIEFSDKFESLSLLIYDGRGEVIRVAVVKRLSWMRAQVGCYHHRKSIANVKIESISGETL